MTGLPDNNSGNDFIRGLETRACVNGMTKSDVERLKNALVKKIVNDDTIVEMTDDGKIIVADGDGLYLSFDGNILGLIKDSSGDYIPQTVSYLPEDENENPLAPPNDTIMTSANIAVDPRIVHTTGNENIAGEKIFSSPTINIEKSMLFAKGWTKLFEFNNNVVVTCELVSAESLIFIHSTRQSCRYFTLSTSGRSYSTHVKSCVDSQNKQSLWINADYNSNLKGRITSISTLNGPGKLEDITILNLIQQSEPVVDDNIISVTNGIVFSVIR